MQVIPRKQMTFIIKIVDPPQNILVQEDDLTLEQVKKKVAEVLHGETLESIK